MQGDVLSSAIGVVLTISIVTPASAQVWINEFHYDDSGPDSGEFIEVIAASHLTDLSTIRVTLYNGGDGNPYGVSHLLSSFTPGATSSGLIFYYKSITGLQNGPPDGLSLDHDGQVLQFISYEGSFTANSGPASGLASTDIGVAENDDTVEGSSLGLTGSGYSPGDFTWMALHPATPGMPNAAQTVVPEPATYALGACVLLLAMAVLRTQTRSMWMAFGLPAAARRHLDRARNPDHQSAL